MNILATRSTRLFAAMTAVIIMAFAMVMTASAQAAPERPTDLTATAVDHDTVSLTWSHPDPATVDHYQVLSRRADSGAGITQAGTSTTTSFEHDGLEPESTYIYRVKAVNSQGEEGQRSARAEATTPAEETPAPPVEPTPEPDPTPAPPQRSDGEGQGNIARAAHNVLVSNTGQTSQNTTISLDSAQPFTTGTNTAGYVLTSVVIGYNDSSNGEFSASVWTTNSSGIPNALKHSLTAPTTFSQGDLTFTANANATLNASTTYTIVMVPSSVGITSKRTSTENPDEDSGAAVGWSIGDTYHFKAGGVFIASSSNKPILIAIQGSLSASETLLVSNLNVDGEDNDTNARIAQRFNTGQNPGGYTLTTVEVSYADSEGDTFAAMVCTVVGSDQPTSTCTELTPPSTFTAGLITFTAPAATELTASTKYTLVLTPETGKTLTYSATAYDVEDSDSLPNWNIAGEYRYESGSTWEQQPQSEALQIRLKGYLLASTLPEISFDNINISVDEDDSQATLSLELSQASADTVTVDYATSDSTALAGDDYTATSGTLTFAAGDTSKTVSITILNDGVYEPTESFSFTLSNPTGATLPNFPGAQVSIHDDESPPTASIANVTLDEGTDTMILRLNLSHESSRPTGYFATSSDVGGTATQGADYENFLSGGEARITVPAGDTQARLDITITDDMAAEISETITIHWENDASSGNGDATPASMDFTGTIIDNDSGVQLTIQDASADETNSSIFFTIVSSETLTQDVTFDYSTSIGASDSAEADDFDPESTVTHTLGAGSITGFIDIDLNDDNLYEGDETFTVTISNPVNASIADATATGTIIDDETPPQLSIFNASATEGEAIEFTVLLVGDATEGDVTFDYATRRQSDDNSESDDFTPTTGTGTITAGSTSTTFTVPTYDDGRDNDTTSIYEGDETFTVTISNPTLAGISQATAKGTIVDDERLPTVKFVPDDRIKSENTGTITDFIWFSVVPKSEQSSQISLTIAGTATGGDDYVNLPTTLTLSMSQTTIATPITLLNDDVAELDETLIITVVAASANIQVDPYFSTRTLTITDDDEHPTLGFATAGSQVNEDAGHAVLTVNKTGFSDFPVHVDYETVDRLTAIAGQDYVATSGTLTFQPEEFSKTISVPIIDNNIYGDIGQRFDVDLKYSSQSNDQNVPTLGTDTTIVTIISDDPVPTASMANVIANERAGTMTLTLRLSNPSSEDIQYIANHHAVNGTATRGEDYVDFIPGAQAYITVSAGQQSGHFDITLIDDGLEEEDESIHIRWVRREPSMVNPQYVDFIGTITDPPVCDALGNLENTIVVMNLTGEITQADQSQFHRIRLDPYRSYLIEAIGQVGEDMLGVEEHHTLTLSNPDIPAIWNAKATSRWSTYGDRNDGTESKNVIRRFLDSSYRTYKVEVDSGTGGTGTYQLKIRVNNICRLDQNDNAHYQWAGGPKGYPKNSDLPAGTGGRQVLLAGTDWGNDNITRPEIHHVLGDNWNSDRDEDWIGVDLEGGELYTVRLRTKNNLPGRLQATGLKVLGIYDSNGNPISGTASAGAAGKKVFVTDWTAPSTGRFHIAVGSEGNDRTGTYWLSITRKANN